MSLCRLTRSCGTEESQRYDSNIWVQQIEIGFSAEAHAQTALQARSLNHGTNPIAGCLVLMPGGEPQENIITMVQDDLAKNFMNPHPGKIYNKPGGPNVYEDVTLVGYHDESLIN